MTLLKIALVNSSIERLGKFLKPQPHQSVAPKGELKKSSPLQKGKTIVGESEI
jgi:hypothetical protein